MTFKKFFQWYVLAFFVNYVFTDLEPYFLQEPLTTRSPYVGALILGLPAMWFAWYEDRKKTADSGGKNTQDPSQG